jgi:hypothetical protein
MVRSHARRVQGLLKSQYRSVGRSPRRICENSSAKSVPAKTPSKQPGQISKLLHPFRVYQSSYFELGAVRRQSGSGLSKSYFAEALAGCSRRFSTLVWDRTLFDLVRLVREGSSGTFVFDLGRHTSSRKRGDPGTGDETIPDESAKTCRADVAAE